VAALVAVVVDNHPLRVAPEQPHRVLTVEMALQMFLAQAGEVVEQVRLALTQQELVEMLAQVVLVNTRTLQVLLFSEAVVVEVVQVVVVLVPQVEQEEAVQVAVVLEPLEMLLKEAAAAGQTTVHHPSQEVQAAQVS
jgi:hypothetical protein